MQQPLSFHPIPYLQEHQLRFLVFLQLLQELASLQAIRC